jgi:radical SAM superfamily enzyme YgiQ (UPF0313 family)
MKGHYCQCLENRARVDFLFVLPSFQTGAGLKYPMHPGVGAEFPFSISLLMAYLEKGGIRTGVLDMNVERDPLKLLDRTVQICQPSIVGLSSYSANVLTAAAIAERVKRLREVPIILGGFHATALPEESLRTYPAIDFVVHGEAERSLPLLVDRLMIHSGVEQTPNLVYRDGDRITINAAAPMIEDLDELPFPLVERFSYRRYIPTPLNFYRLPAIGIMSSRGCPFSCTFCATHFQWNRKVRFMSSKKVVDWIEKLVVDYGIKDVRFYDDTFTLSKSRVHQFCEELLKRNLKIAWNCYSRVDTIDAEMALLMKRSGCYQVKFGIEAGTNESLNRIKKGITIDKAREAVNLARRAGLESKASFMFGIHDETLQASHTTLDFALDLDPSFATFQIMMIHPGSQDFGEFSRAGRIPEDFTWDRPFYVSNQDQGALEKLLQRAYRQFYLRPRFLLRQLVRLVTNTRSQLLRIAYSLKYFITRSLTSFHRESEEPIALNQFKG